MKKIIILLAILACGIGEVKATKVYLKPNANWLKDNARFAVYAFNSTDGSKNEWYNMSAVADHDGYYEAEFDNTQYDKIIFCRMNGSNSTNDWKDGIKYNQSEDIVPSATALYTITENMWDGKDNPICVKREKPSTYYLYFSTNSNALYGNRVEMNLESDGTYTATIDNQTNPQTYYAMIVPSYAEESAGTISSASWDAVCFPDANDGTDGNEKRLTLSWANSQGNIVNSNSWSRWKIDGIAAKFKITFDWLSSWSITPYFTRTINTSVGYSTFSSDYAVAIPEGVTAYYASGANSSTKKVTMTKFENGIAVNTGALLYKSGGGEVKFTPATSTDNVSGSNLLKHTTGSDIYDKDKAQYVLAKAIGSNDVSTIAFKKVGSSYSPAKGSAYLETESALAPSFEIFFDDAAGGTTAIDAVKSAEPSVTDGAYYNLAGQRVTNPTKGLYIVNGRKVVVK